MTHHPTLLPPTTDHDAPPTAWTGELVLELRNGRDWAAGQSQVTLALDTLRVRILGRELAIILRDWFRNWIDLSDPQPYQTDEILWTRQRGAVCLQYGTAFFTVTAESLANLRLVL